jgi:hypothetical protein
MAQLHETLMGKKLITHDIPELIRNIENLGRSLEKINDILDDMHLLFLELKEKENGRSTRDGKSDINTQ